MDNLKNAIENLYNNPPEKYSEQDRDLFARFIEALNRGEIRAAEKIDCTWQVNGWIKKGILIGFRMGSLEKMPQSRMKYFIDKSTYPERSFEIEDGVRVVPGGTSVRTGSFLAKSVVVMPPSYINVGGYVDEGSMIDSHALVGSCAQVGRRVHLSAGAILGGVLEPIGAQPVIIEDDVFIGGNSGIFDGIIVGNRAIIAAGVIITQSTPVYDAVNGEFLDRSKRRIPEGAVIVPGSRPLKGHEGFSVYCPIIIKYRDEKSDVSVTLEDTLR